MTGLEAELGVRRQERNDGDFNQGHSLKDVKMGAGIRYKTGTIW